MKAYYFGCWNSVGHYTHDPKGKHVYSKRGGGFYPDDQPWEKIDGMLTPGQRNDQGRLVYDAMSKEHQGEAALHHKDGWTALAIHDFTVDSRPNSNSVFLLKGTLNAAEALIAARENFPQVYARIAKTTPIKIVEETE